MRGLHTYDLRCFALVAALALACASPSLLPEARGQTDDKTASQPAAPLSVTTNLVVVPVVVRDAKGRPVEGLTKDDFKLFDRGQEQSITQFEAHSSLAPAPAVGETTTSTTASTALPGNFLALYFDDLYSSATELNQARDAAVRYLTTHLQPRDRVGIFTSAAVLTDFTADPQQIHDALFKLRAGTRALKLSQDCPQLTDYQAYAITEGLDADALTMAVDEALRCSNTSPSARELVIQQVTNDVQNQARRAVEQGDILARTNLGGIEQVVATIARMPGQRTVILVSPGFLTYDDQEPLDHLINVALRSQVVISSLDPKGVAVRLREADASQSDLGIASVARYGNKLDNAQEINASAVLEEVAHGTGGEFFHSNNDLNAGFSALAGSPAYYTLAFAPTDLKLDGKFHLLKVTLADSQKGYNLQARRGYFAARNATEMARSGNTDAKAAGNTSGDATAPDPVAHEQIREALFARNDTTQLAVKLDVKLGEGRGETRPLALSSHLDGAGLPFRKDGDTSTNTVTFVFGVFDAKGNLLSAQQKHVDLTVPDGQMPNFLQAGVGEDVSFDLKPGSYRVREVVIDSEQHHLTTLSRSVKIP